MRLKQAKRGDMIFMGIDDSIKICLWIRDNLCKSLIEKEAIVTLINYVNKEM